MSSFTLEHAIVLEEALRVRKLQIWYSICSTYLIPDDLQKDVIQWIMDGNFEEKVSRRKKPPMKVTQYKLTKVLKKHDHKLDVLHHC
jgi:hypothetical protein